MENKQKKEQNIKTATTLAEFILLPIHVKMNVLPNPQIVTGFVADATGQVNWEANSWSIEILNSDFGKENIKISDHLLNDVVLLAQNIAERAYKKLLDENAKEDMVNYIYSNTKTWSQKLQELGIK